MNYVCNDAFNLMHFTGPKGDRGFKGEQGEAAIRVSTSETISTSSGSEYFFGLV